MHIRLSYAFEEESFYMVTSYVFTPPDLSCCPRRDGGMVEQRSLVRTFERLLRYSPLGLPVVAGIIPECMSVRAAGAAAACYPQLTHPGVQRLLPASLNGIYAKATSATTKRAVGMYIYIYIYIYIYLFMHVYINIILYASIVALDGAINQNITVGAFASVN